MRRILLLLIMSATFIFEIQAQPLRIEWQQCYGGSDIDGGASVLQSKKGFALFSQTYSNDDQISGNHGKWTFV